MENLIQQLEATGDYRVIRKLEKRGHFHEDPNAIKKIGVVIDVETTGLDFGQENIIELGILIFEFSSDGRIFKILQEFGEFEDPGKPIPQEITKLTGIKDADVKGTRIDDAKVNELVKDAVIIIAHNAGFDRPFVERRFPIFSEKFWACSQTQIPWKSEGISGSKLEYIAYSYKFFYGAHRAIDDCWALLKILSKDLPSSGCLVLNTLLSNARKTTYHIEATGAPYDKKDLLKKRRYRWNGETKSWSKEVDESEREEEEEFLKTSVYVSQGGAQHHEIRKITGKTRFSKRT